MFLKKSCSSDGEGDGDGEGVGAGDVCALTETAAAKIKNGTTTLKRHCERLFLRMLLSPLDTVDTSSYLLTTSTTNESGLMLRCGRPPGVAGGASVISAVDRKIFFVFGSNAIVRAPACVFTGPTSS